MSTPQTNTYSAMGAIGTVFRRELRENLFKKSILITLVIAVLLTVGGVIATWFLTNDDTPETTSIAVVGDAPFAKSVAEFSAAAADAAQGSDTDSATNPNADAPTALFAAALGSSISTVELIPAESADAARAAVTDGDAVAALYPGEAPGQWVLLDDDAPTWLPAMLQEALTAETQAQQIAELGGDPAAFAEGVAGARVTVEQLTESDVDVATILVVGVGLFVMMTGILMFGGAVAQSVIEEKSSRVIEIMLATVRPLHLLIGKILGAAAAGLVMLATIIAAAVISVFATGLAKNFDIPWASILILLPYFLVGYLFFAALYATAGSMVSRMEDFAGVQTPVIILSMLTMYIPAFGWSNLDSTFMQVMSWVPPVSVTMAPLQYAIGNLSVAGLVGSLAVTALVTAAVVVMAAKIYPRNVLRTGAPVTWRQALKSGVRN